MSDENILLIAAGYILSLVILYYIIKGAVKNGILAAEETKITEHKIGDMEKQIQPDNSWNDARRALAKRFEKGELTTEQYREEFNKAGTV